MLSERFSIILSNIWQAILLSAVTRGIRIIKVQLNIMYNWGKPERAPILVKQRPPRCIIYVYMYVSYVIP